MSVTPEPELLFGLTKVNLLQIAEMIVIVLMSVAALFIAHLIIKHVVGPLARTAYINSPPRWDARHFIRVALYSLAVGAFSYAMFIFFDDPQAIDIAVQGTLLGIAGILVWYALHMIFIPFWNALPSSLTIQFTSQAPGYEDLRPLSYQQRGLLALITAILMAALILIGRSAGWWNEQQAIVFGFSAAEFVRDLEHGFVHLRPHEHAPQLGQEHVLWRIETMIIVGLYFMFMWFAARHTTRILSLIPAFTINLKLADYHGLLAACGLGIYLGYLIPVF